MKKNSKNAYSQDNKNSYSSRTQSGMSNLSEKKNEKSGEIEGEGEAPRSFEAPYGSSQKGENKK